MGHVLSEVFAQDPSSAGGKGHPSAPLMAGLQKVRMAVLSCSLETPKDGECHSHVTCPRAAPPSWDPDRTNKSMPAWLCILRTS